MNFHDARGTLAARLSLCRAARRTRWPPPGASSRSGSSPATASRWSPKPAPNSPPLSSAPIYAGAWPVPLPLPTSFGGREAYVEQLKVMLDKQRPGAVPLPGRTCRLRRRGRRAGAASQARDWDTLGRARRSRRPSFRPRAATTSPICNIRAARPASRTASRSPTARCSTIFAPTASGSRSATPTACISWLPWYHDMGLVGCMLSPVANQLSVDYLKTEDFARRPLAWLDLITRNPGTTLSYSPTFGYDICARRMSRRPAPTTASTCRAGASPAMAPT